MKNVLLLLLTAFCLLPAGAQSTLDLRNPGGGKAVEYDFSKQNPRFRSLAPRERKCGTVEAEKTRSILGGPETQQQFEDWMNQSILRLEEQRSVRRSASSVYTLPVVVHIIYSNPVENISDAQVLSQIEVLNEDYRRKNPDQASTKREFQKIAADTEIEFCLAGIDPQGKATSGINRVSWAGSPFTERYINEVIKPRTIWDPTRYCNIWVCNIAAGVLGFAQFPASSGLSGIPQLSTAAQTDGVVINYNSFGTLGTAVAPFNRGRTATHEMGHWLGLRHIWGDGACEVDDYCADTPDSDAPHYQCPGQTFGCDGGLAMHQNYMDYTDDACMNLFTVDQKKRMIAVLENSPRRKSLLSSNACRSPLSAPQPAFTADLQAGCAPLTVRFSDQSGQQPERFSWSFPGGKPETSEGPNPVVVYRKAGIYPVTLRVANAAGERSLLKEGFIEVRGEGGPLPFAADFELADLEAAGFRIVNPDRDGTWEHSGRVSGSGKGRGALRIANYDNPLRNSADWLLSPLLDFSGGQGAKLSFQVAYAGYGGPYADSLGVFVATGCTSEFKQVYLKGGEQLATAQPYNQLFVPLEQEWRTEEIDLSAWDGQPFVQVAIVNFNGNGNDLYLDNLRISQKRHEAPLAAFAADSALCAGGSVRFQDRSENEPTRWAWSFPGGFPSSDTSASPVITYSLPGIYDVILTVSNAAGSHTLTRKGAIVVTQAPTITLQASPQSICPGQALSLRAEGAGQFEWDIPGRPVSPDTRELVLTPTQDAVYRVAARGLNGCRAEASATVRVRQDRKMSILPPQATVCPGESVTLQALGMDSYLWSPEDGLDRSSGSLVKASPRQTTVYTVTGFTQDGCEISQNVEVRVEDGGPSVRAVADRQDLCPGESLRITASGGASYSWSPAEGLNRSEGSEVLASPRVSTVYTLSARLESGCEVSRTVKIDVKPRPVLSLRADKTAICPGEAVTLSASGAERVYWNPGESLRQTEGLSVQAGPRVPTVYQAIGVNYNGCSDTASIEIQTLSSAQIRVSPEQAAVCLGSGATLRAEGGVSYTWSPAVGLNRLSGPEVIASPFRDQVYTLTARDEQGCLTRIEVPVRVSAGFRPTGRIESEQQVACAGQAVEFRSNAANAAAFYWEFTNAEPATSTEPNPRVSFQTSGPQDVVLTLTGCDGSLVRYESLGHIIITSPLNLQVNTERATACRDEPYELVASGADRYEWAPALGLDRQEGPRVLASPATRTTYTVTGYSNDGCRASREITLDVTGEGNRLHVEPANPVICLGESVSLNVSGTYTYRWSPEAGLDGVQGPSVRATPRSTTVYTVEGTDLDGCVFRRSVTVEVKPVQQIKVNPAAPTLCGQDAVSLRIEGSGLFSWSPAYGLSSATGSEVRASPRETTTYRVSGNDENGCKAMAEVTVQVQRLGQLALLARDTLICPGDSTELVVTGGEAYAWKPAEGLGRPAGNSVKVAPRQSTSYTVVSGEGACREERTVLVRVRPASPLAITPAAPAICLGDTLTLRASGGSNLRWASSPSVLDRMPGSIQVSPRSTEIFYVSGQDPEGCAQSGSVTVQVRPAHFVSISASAPVICKGKEVLLLAEGASQYEWIQGEQIFSPSAARSYARPGQSSTYRVVGSDELGCRDTASFRVEVRDLRAAFDLSPGSLDLAKGPGAVRFTDQTPGAKAWNWSFGEGSISQEQNPLHIYGQPGSYTVRLTASDGICEHQASRKLEVVNSSQVGELASIQLNRVAGSKVIALEINSPSAMTLDLRLRNAAGQELVYAQLRLQAGPYSQQLDLSSFPEGAYRMEFSDGKNTVAREFSL